MASALTGQPYGGGLPEVQVVVIIHSNQMRVASGERVMLEEACNGKSRELYKSE